MAFYLLQEDGSKLYLEDLSGFILLEEVSVPPPSINWQAGGAGYPVRKRRRTSATQELFDGLEQTLQVLMGLVPADLESANEPAEAVRPASFDGRSGHIEAVLARLTEVARGHRALEARLERLRKGFAAYEAERAQDDDETWLLML